MLRRLWRQQGRWLVVIVGFVAMAVVVGGYVVSQQRLRLPFQDRYRVDVAFATVQSLTPNTGQPVAVAGVQVGEVTGVRLRAGRPIVSMSIDPAKLPRVYANARAEMVPLTPLKNMQIDLDPGDRSARALRPGATIDSSRTTTTIDVDQILAGLDADSRLYFEQLLAAAGNGLDGRGKALGDTMALLGPTAQQGRRITAALADRDRLIRQLVHDLTVVADATGDDGERVGQLVDDLGATLGSLGQQDAALRRSLRQLPGTLRHASDTVDRTSELVRTATRTARTLRPAIRRLPATTRDVRRLLRRTEPFLRDDARPLVRQAMPTIRSAVPLVRRVQAITPPARRVMAALAYAFNELVADPGDGRKGYLYWGSWFFHNANSMLSTSDASGSAWRLLPLINCSALTADPVLGAVLRPLLGGLTGGCS
ncbi:MCE-family protein Mce6D [Patulibacter medicamentivorans]|uniref:MCE-family protein Mce6D n=1 Tax=Patulibacter medicamentivorans TaxID=1097667 RepID=H0E9M1_9ACTN|nr:MlaD family protein [Patulibacter medicamentivorans]EHN09621.1 MCE-family protein Mce6D [Patulibacter medicamentivorans]